MGHNEKEVNRMAESKRRYSLENPAPAATSLANYIRTNPNNDEQLNGRPDVTPQHVMAMFIAHRDWQSSPQRKQEIADEKAVKVEADKQKKADAAKAKADKAEAAAKAKADKAEAARVKKEAAAKAKADKAEEKRLAKEAKEAAAERNGDGEDDSAAAPSPNLRDSKRQSRRARQRNAEAGADVEEVAEEAAV